MWIHTTDGFFSVVRKPGDTMLTVRARSGADLDRLRERHLPSLGATTTTSDTDYRYRAVASAEDWAAAAHRMALAIDYDNFKDAAGAALGTRRASILGEVWSALRRIPPEAPRPHAIETFGGVVEAADGRILLVKRDGHWTLPATQRSHGELPHEAALRAVFDQARMAVDVVERIPGTFGAERAEGTWSASYWRMRVPSAPVELREGHDGLRWETVHAALTRAIAGWDLEVLGAYQRVLGAQVHDLTGIVNLSSVPPGPRPPAARGGWKTRRMPKRTRRLEHTRLFRPAEVTRLRWGFVPYVMEEKWFVLYEAHHIRFHRSWTGILVYDVELREASGGAEILGIRMNAEPRQYKPGDDDEERRRLDGLFDWLLSQPY